MYIHWNFKFKPPHLGRCPVNLEAHIKILWSDALESSLSMSMNIQAQQIPWAVLNNQKIIPAIF